MSHVAQLITELREILKNEVPEVPLDLIPLEDKYSCMNQLDKKTCCEMLRLALSRKNITHDELYSLVALLFFTEVNDNYPHVYAEIMRSAHESLSWFYEDRLDTKNMSLCFLEAVQQGDLENVTHLLAISNKRSIHVTDKDEELFFAALRCGNPEVLFFLFENFGNPHHWDKNEESRMLIDRLIEVAVREEIYVMLDFLTDNKTSLWTMHVNMALIHASAKGDMIMVRYMASRGANAWNHVLWVAASQGDQEMVNLALEKGAADFNLALEASIDTQHLEVARLLVEKGANDERQLEKLRSMPDDSDDEMLRMKCAEYEKRRILRRAIIFCLDRSPQTKLMTR